MGSGIHRHDRDDSLISDHQGVLENHNSPYATTNLVYHLNLNVESYSLCITIPLFVRDLIFGIRYTFVLSRYQQTQFNSLT
jgi:hypothetical protein